MCDRYTTPACAAESSWRSGGSPDAERPGKIPLVPPPHETVESLYQGYPARTLISHDADLEATFVPGVGMIGVSLKHKGDELLGQRGGLARYEATRSTMGIPLLHPWANRLDGYEYAAAGRNVQLDPDSPLLKKEEHGLPIHGFLGASPYWELLGSNANDTLAGLSARLDFGAHPEYLEGFPYPHELQIDVILRGPLLTIRTTLTPTGSLSVPFSFGFHPYFTLPAVAREDWHLELPRMERLAVDDRLIPTGDLEPFAVEPGPLGDRTYDNVFTSLPDPPRFALAGGGRRVAVEFLGGYRYAVVYAPGDDDVVAFEPMTAPTNALVSGDGLDVVAPGESRSATFSVSVEPE
ncbi:MAG: aldose 1-epimerase [Thermoleophilaceae bacterium]|nr:aldose 1-epimerase [Thermoleophilaceae bacterium]